MIAVTAKHSSALGVKPAANPARSAHPGFRWLLALWLAAVSTLTAAEQIRMMWLKVGTKTYRRITILGASETDLYFKHSGGVANVKLKDLDPEMQKRFDYDPKLAAEAEQRQMQEDSAYFETVALDVATRAQKATAARLAETAAAERAARSETSLADPISGQSPLNQPAPKLEVAKWLGEKPATEGKAVLVFFWATWSTPCRKVIPELNSHQKTFRDRLVVVGLAAQEENEVADFKHVQIDFPLAVDPQDTLAKAVGVTSVPQALLIDAKGIVRYVGHPAALDSAALKKFFADHTE